MGWPSAARARSKNQRLRRGAAQGIGAHHAHAVGAHGAQPLAESLEAAQRTVRRRIVQSPAVAEAGGQAHHFAQSIQDDELAVRVARDDHVKTVGTEIDGGEHVGHDTPTAAHLLRSNILRRRKKSRSRRWFSRLGCE